MSLSQDAASQYAELGWSVAPAPLRGKSPIKSWKGAQANRLTSTKAKTAFGGVEKNIFIVCGSVSRLAVLDCDSAAATTYWRERLGDVLDQTTCATSGRESGEGRHYYFRLAVGEVHKGRDGDGWTLRAEAGGVIAPPSLHASGSRYAWLPEHGPDALQDAPAALWPTEQAQAASAPETRTKLAELLAAQPAEGERNNWLTALCGHLAKEIKYRDAYDQLVYGYGREVDLDDAEIKKTAESIWSKEHAKISDGPTSWAPVELQEILAGEYVQPEPTMLARVDKRCLVYPGRVHGWNAEPESLKTWLALWACAERLATGEQVLYVDFEDSAPSIVGRLRALGADPDTLAQQFTYLRPDEALTQTAQADFDRVLERKPTLVVIDGMTEAYTREGLNPENNQDIAKWIARLPRHVVLTTGAAVVLLDHVVKDRESRGRWAIGGQHKLAGIDVALSLSVVAPLSRVEAGSVLIKVEKDRPGGIREFASKEGYVAALEAIPTDLGKHLAIRLEPPKAQEVESARPKETMQRISMTVEEKPGLSKNALREATKGKTALTELGRELLINEGFIETRKDGQTVKHYSLKPYREIDDDGFQ